MSNVRQRRKIGRVSPGVGVVQNVEMLPKNVFQHSNGFSPSGTYNRNGFLLYEANFHAVGLGFSLVPKGLIGAYRSNSISLII